MTDSEASASSRSSEDSGDGHPINAAVAGRHGTAARERAPTGGGGNASRQQGKHLQSSSPEGRHLQAANGVKVGGREREDLDAAISSDDASSGSSSKSQADDLDNAGTSSSSSSDGSGDESDKEEEAAMPLRAPVGVIVVDELEEGPSSEMKRLLRTPRYFDPDVEEAGMRCFKCGGKGHRARDCTNPAAKQRSCFLCAQFGHDSRDCPAALCWRCQRPGHMARDCPYGYRAAPWGQAQQEATCLRCGRPDCPCAGQKDYVRASGGCPNEYDWQDLQHVRCFVCGRRGHLCCKPISQQPAPKPSCANCGTGGHTAEECPQELTKVMRSERLGGRPPPPQQQQYSSGGYYQQQRRGSGGDGGYYQQQQQQQQQSVSIRGYSAARQVRYSDPAPRYGREQQHSSGKRRYQEEERRVEYQGRWSGHGGGGGKRGRY